MRRMLGVTLAILCTAGLYAQTADELIAKNLQAKGGVEKIKAITSERMAGQVQAFGIKAIIQIDAKIPDLYRTVFTVQGMSEIQAYDGDIAWQISPFEGRKDPEQLGEDDLRDMQESANFYGPLVDYQQQGNTATYLGKDNIDGDDVYKLKLALKNGDNFYYYLDPDSMLEVRVERQQFIRGAVHERVFDYGSYKLVNGVYFPFSVESGPKRNPESRIKITFTSIKANLPLEEAEFKMPAAPAVPSPQKHPEPPTPNEKEKKPPKVPANPPKQ
jgi:hypothetical protein